MPLMIVLIMFLIFLDQLSKYLVDLHLPLYEEIIMIPRFFSLTHVRNRGAAWGVLSMQSWGTAALSVLAFLMSVFIGFLILRCRKRPLRIVFCIVFAGSIGNLIDRLWRGEVVDFLLFHFGSYRFPAFNLADSMIVCGGILLFFFLMRDEYYEDLLQAIGQSPSPAKDSQGR